MKRLIAICLTLALFSSCSTDEGSSYHYEILPVDSVDIPDEFEMGETYPITIHYSRPSTCYGFSEFYYSKHNNERTVAPVDIVLESNNCETPENEMAEATFDFLVTGNGSYIFKFWQGKDEDGESQYLTIEVPVVETSAL
ncbi:hypothetical protein [Tamlana sp. I1]|uniref:hypothetical protein n=1 Tax=Tamlana sp. I1 TaxID=2762061 RepID=UPI00188E2E2A|nr:hypothetical protein [Tamlana sp. I1]